MHLPIQRVCRSAEARAVGQFGSGRFLASAAVTSFGPRHPRLGRECALATAAFRQRSAPARWSQVRGSSPSKSKKTKRPSIGAGSRRTHRAWRRSAPSAFAVAQKSPQSPQSVDFAHWPPVGCSSVPATAPVATIRSRSGRSRHGHGFTDNQPARLDSVQRQVATRSRYPTSPGDKKGRTRRR